ncbi:MAG: nucleotide exchange factor GrpE [Planctomycetes bacterium]|jgi:molecular chaperone GrpE|nr:nucleotide exchange factor GrpE [Planctomycetota bacterium]
MDKEKTKPDEPPEQKEHDTPETSGAGLEELQRDLESVRKEKDDLTDRLQRVYADYANFQKRVPKNIADTVAYEKERFIRSFLPVLDNLDRTLRETGAAHDFDAVLRGVQIVRDQMLSILKTHGVEPIEAVNDPFDPERHEAMLRRTEPDRENDIVLEEFQKGYTLGGRVLRPSRVAVNKVPASREKTPDAKEEAAASPPGAEASTSPDRDQ